MPVLTLADSKDELCGERFWRFLDVCFAYADSFSMAKFPLSDCDVVPNGAEVLLEPYQLKTLTPNSWYGYSQYSGRMIQTIYCTTPDALQIMKRCYQDIFLQKRNKVPKVPVDTVGFRSKWVSVLEDLCFWHKGNICIGTISHERICTTNQIDDVFAQKLCELAAWHIEDKPEYNIDKIKL